MSNHHQTVPEGSVTTPVGFVAAAVAAGIKQSGRPDLVLVAADRDCAPSGLFSRHPAPQPPLPPATPSHATHPPD